MTYLYIVLLMLLSYLFGSFPSGVIVGQIFKQIDIRMHGSKNTGTTNSIRVLGWGLGSLVFILDILKGAAVIWILKFLIQDPSLYAFGSLQVSILSLYGLMAVVGHVFPVFLKFKGGKAVATTSGIMLAIEPWSFVAAVLIFLIFVLVSRYVSVSSTVITILVLSFYIIRAALPHWWNSNWPSRIVDAIIMLSCAVIIILRHKTNYQRLQAGIENKV